MRIPGAVLALSIVAMSCPLTFDVAGAGTVPLTEPAPTRTSTDALDAPELEVLSRGASPRKELRYTVPVGTSQTLQLRTFSRITQRQDGQVRSSSTPNITFTIVADVAAVADTGDVTYSYRYDDVEVGSGGAPGSRAQTQELVESVIGVGGTITITDTGEPVESTFDIPDTVDESLAPLLDQVGSQTNQLATPLPETSVGVGARWRVTQHPTFGGVQFTQRVVFEVESLEGSRVTLSSQTVQRATRQEFTPPGSDSSVLLLSSRGTGRGSTTVDPAKLPMPVEGTTDIRLVQRLRQGGSTLRQTVQSAAFLND